MATKALNQYHICDARRLKQLYQKKNVSVTITSPPYGSLKDYGVSDQIGYGQEYDQIFLNNLSDVFQQCYDITKDKGSLWVIVDTFKEKGRMKYLPFDLARQLEDQTGWILRDIIIWDKGKTLPWSRKGQLRNSFEYILFFTKSAEYQYYIDRIKEAEDLKEWWVKYPERYNPKGKTPTNIWQVPIPTQGAWKNSHSHHFCPFPEELIERILLLTTNKGDVVLDPFAGSGVVLAQADCMHRNWLGFDVQSDYKQMFESEVKHRVAERWEARSQLIKNLETAKETLGSKIHRLRMLKYPKTLVKELIKESRRNGITDISIPSCVFALKQRFQGKVADKPNHFLKEQVLIFFKDVDEVKLPGIAQIISEIVERKPLSKFGISSDIEIFQEKDTTELFLKSYLPMNAHLYLYSKGKTNYYVKSATLKRWLEIMKSNEWAEYQYMEMPPILSNIKIRQEIERTWKYKK